MCYLEIWKFGEVRSYVEKMPSQLPNDNSKDLDSHLFVTQTKIPDNVTLKRLLKPFVLGING